MAVGCSDGKEGGMSRFAEKTSVPSDRSRSEIEKTLRRYGATGFMYGWKGDFAVIAFEAQGIRIRFNLPMPNINSDEIRLTPTGKERAESAIEGVYEQAVKQRWRALALVIKAKLEAVETGITLFEEEFLAHIMLPDGGTVGQFMLPQVKTAYETGNMPPLLEHG